MCIPINKNRNFVIKKYIQMENKCSKKSTMQQLKTLVLFMEENPELARGAPIFGANKYQVDEEWKKLCSNLNALGPPSRTIGEWKKTWADLKSRTKKKIGENQKSLRETGGGLYRYNNLTELEVIIDRTLFVSSAVAPGGKVFGVEDQSIDDCFVALVESPGGYSKSVAVVTPTRSSETSTNKQKSPRNVHQSSKEQQQNTTAVTAATKRQESCFNDGENYPVASHSAKKGKFATEEINLIRRQLRIAEGNAATAAEQANSMKRLADAAEVQAEATKRMANAAETTAAGIAELVKATIRFENILEKHFSKS